MFFIDKKSKGYLLGLFFFFPLFFISCGTQESSLGQISESNLFASYEINYYENSRELFLTATFRLNDESGLAQKLPDNSSIEVDHVGLYENTFHSPYYTLKFKPIDFSDLKERYTFEWSQFNGKKVQIPVTMAKTISTDTLSNGDTFSRSGALTLNLTGPIIRSGENITALIEAKTNVLGPGERLSIAKTITSGTSLSFSIEELSSLPTGPVTLKVLRTYSEKGPREAHPSADSKITSIFHSTPISWTLSN